MIAARHAQRLGAKRVVIFDYDVHHGNGTQDLIHDDDSVLFISLHRCQKGKFYPNSGMLGDKVIKNVINIPWDEFGLSDADYMFTFESVLAPIIREFDPDFAVMSSGFDVSEGDYLGKYVICMLSLLATG